MADKRLNAIIAVDYQGTGADRAKRAMKGVGQETDRMGREQAEAAVKSAALQRKLSELSREVVSNAKSVDEATREYEEYKKELGQVARETEKAKEKTGGFDAKLGALAGAGAFMAMNAIQGLTSNITSMISESIAAASTMQETESLLRNALGPAYDDYSKQLEEFADVAKRSRVELEQGSSTIIAMTRSMGANQQQAADMGVSFSKMAVDLGSYFNKDTEQVFLDFQSALAGSAETLQKYGLDARESALQQVALNHGLISGKEKMDRFTRAQALQITVMEQASDAMGDAVRTSDSYENSQKGMQAAILDLKVAFGEMLIPTMTKVVQGIEGIVRASEPLIKMINDEYAQAIEVMVEENIEGAASMSDLVAAAKELADIAEWDWGQAVRGEAVAIEEAKVIVVRAMAEMAKSPEEFAEALRKAGLDDYSEAIREAARQTANLRREAGKPVRESFLPVDNVEMMVEAMTAYYEMVQKTAVLEETRAGYVAQATARNQQAADMQSNLTAKQKAAIAAGLELTELEQEHIDLMQDEADHRDEQRWMLEQATYLREDEIEVLRAESRELGKLDRQAGAINRREKQDAVEKARQLREEIQLRTQLYRTRQEEVGRQAVGTLGELAKAMEDNTVLTVEGWEEQQNWNNELFEAAAQAGITGAAFMGLAQETGLYTDAQIRAAIKAEAIRVKIEELAQQVADNDITWIEARDQVNDFIDSLDRVPTNITTEIRVKIVGTDLLTDLGKQIQEQLYTPDVPPEPGGGGGGGGGNGNGTSGGGGGSAGTGGDEPEAQHGIRGFITPPGSPTNITVHPGEIVDVYNAGQRMAMGYDSRGGGGGITIESGAIIVNAAPGQDAEEIAETVQALLADELRMSTISGAGGMGR